MELKIIKKPFKGRPVGSVMDMKESQAKLLVKLGRATYLTRDMQASGLTVDVPVILPAEDEPELHLAPVESAQQVEPEPVAPVVQDERETPVDHSEDEPEEAPRRRGGRPRKAQAEE